MQSIYTGHPLMLRVVKFGNLGNAYKNLFSKP